MTDFDWDSLAEATTPAEPVRAEKRIIWEPSADEIEMAALYGTVRCLTCSLGGEHHPIELHDQRGCKVCADCPMTWTGSQIRQIREAHCLRWMR